MVKKRGKGQGSRAKVKKAAKRPKTKKTVSRKVTRAKKPKVKTAKSPEINLEKIGEVTHYFPHVKAAAIMVLKTSIKTGDQIYIKGHTTDFKEKIVSMQIDHVPVQEGKKGDEIGLLVKSRVRIGDSVYRI